MNERMNEEINLLKEKKKIMGSSPNLGFTVLRAVTSPGGTFELLRGLEVVGERKE